MLRRFWPQDISDVYRITMEVFKETYLPNVFLELHSRWPQGIIVAEDKGKVVGFIAGNMPSPMKARILLLAIKRGYRRRGLGSKLLMQFLREAEKIGATSTSLEVRTSNEPAIKFYADHNFQITGVIPDYYNDGEDALVMARDIQWNI